MTKLLQTIRSDASLVAMTWMALAVLVIETTLALLAPESTLVQEYRQVLERAAKEPAPDLLILGDSVARGSILPSVVREHLGRDIAVRNDAMQGTGPEIAFFTLKRLLAAGKVPKAILYAPSPHTFASTRMHIAAGGFCTWPEVVDLLRSGHDRMDILRNLPLRFSYTLRYREPIAEMLKGRRATLALFAPPHIDEAEWVAFSERRSSPRVAEDPGRATLTPKFLTGFSVAPVNAHYLDRFLELASGRGIRVFWAVPPILQRLDDARSASGFHDDYARMLDDLAGTYGVVLLQRRAPVYPDASFYDLNHLDLPASRRLSADLGEHLGRMASPAAVPR